MRRNGVAAVGAAPDLYTRECTLEDTRECTLEETVEDTLEDSVPYGSGEPVTRRNDGIRVRAAAVGPAEVGGEPVLAATAWLPLVNASGSFAVCPDSRTCPPAAATAVRMMAVGVSGTTPSG
ncbi:MAG: hypothetical protein QOE51_1, partial [Actinoplanes sp.]|nr:hypothetical protein [Actinoplanes sp.]